MWHSHILVRIMNFSSYSSIASTMYNHPLRRRLPGSKLGRADWRSEDRPNPDSSPWSRNYNVRTPHTPQASFVPSPLATPYTVRRGCSGVETPEEIEEVI